MSDEPEKGRFDAAAFYAALDRTRAERGLRWKQVGDEAKVSPSTLTRLAQGRRPDVDSLAALVDWAGLSADDFVRRTQPRQETHGTLAGVSTYLRADKNLDDRKAEAIEKVIEVMYRQMTEG
ncbi:helix-turn-helix transcriptional regulator [Micromonospora sp. NPDC047707]|uniref:helix-turn-helix domain-containing protein n=1 Tax=unclassified Micromonospora TaxID=2617518 RepID=UPI00345469E7